MRKKNGRIVVYEDAVFFKQANSPNFYEVKGAEPLIIDVDDEIGINKKNHLKEFIGRQKDKKQKKKSKIAPSSMIIGEMDSD